MSSARTGYTPNTKIIRKERRKKERNDENKNCVEKYES